MAQQETSANLAQRLAETLRSRLINGELKPGQRLSEASLTATFDVSRNTLREAFRLLTKEGLLRHEPNRGVFVETPSMASIVDIYRVRRMIECGAIEHAYPKHPAVKRMRQAVEMALACRADDDWPGVGSANMVFHASIIDLADSGRLREFFSQISAELRLSFGLLDDPEFLHAPYLDLNKAILELVEADKPKEAAIMLGDYLIQSERTVLRAFARSGISGP